MVGAGEVALQKIPSLLTAEAELRVVAPKVHVEIAALAVAGRLEVVERAFELADLDRNFSGHCGNG